MQRRKKIALLLLVFVIATFLIYNIFIREDINLSFALSRYGSNSNEVKQIQTKLKRWGYYNGTIDGIFGSKTLAAVKWFQSANGLTVDGIAGPKTLAAMGILASNNTNNKTNSNSDLNLLAHLVYAEARGESYTRTSSSCSCSIKQSKKFIFPKYSSRSNIPVWSI